MDVLLSSVLGELTTRSINFLISKYSKPMPLDVEDCLRRVLLRAQVIIDEAMGRHITNEAMLLQLVMLRDAMHRGYYMLDAIRYQHHDEEDAKDQVVSRSSSLSIVNSVKHLCFSSRAALPLKELQETLDNLSSMIRDVNELVLFLASYPRLYSQPYSTHLLHPRLTHLAMEIAREKASCLLGAYTVARLLRDNFNGLFWSKVLAFSGCFIKQRISRFGQHPIDPLGENILEHFGRMAAPSEAVVVYHQHQRSSEEEVPRIRLDDVIFGSVKPHGKVEVLVWQSHVPPYYSYVYTCEIQAIKNTGAKRKRSM